MRTTIDPDTGRVDLPLAMTLQWFDLLRQGVVGVVRLKPDGEGAWTFTYEKVQTPTESA